MSSIFAWWSSPTQSELEAETLSHLEKEVNKYISAITAELSGLTDALAHREIDSISPEMAQEHFRASIARAYTMAAHQFIVDIHAWSVDDRSTVKGSAEIRESLNHSLNVSFGEAMASFRKMANMPAPASESDESDEIDEIESIEHCEDLNIFPTNGI